MWSSFYTDSSDHYYDKYEPSLCAFAPNILSNFIRESIRTLSNRQGESFRQICFQFKEYSLLLGDCENAVLQEAWNNFEQECGFEGQLEIVAEAWLLQSILGNFSAEEQLKILLNRDQSLLDLYYFSLHFKTLKKADDFLVDIPLKSVLHIRRTLWFFSESEGGISQLESFQSTLIQLIDSEDSCVRATLFKIIFRSGFKNLIGAFLKSSWKWGSTSSLSCSENHWGSLCFCKYGISLNWSEIEERIEPYYLPYAYVYRGSQACELEKLALHYSKYLELLSSQQQELPAIFPKILVSSFVEDSPEKFSQVSLSRKNFHSSHYFANPLYMWGGIDFLNQDQDQNQTYSEWGNEGKNWENLSSEMNSLIDNQQNTGNSYFADAFSVPILLKIVTSKKSLVEQWLKPLQIDSEKPSPLIDWTATFYQSLCCALFLSPHEALAIKLYRYLSQYPPKVKVIDLETNIASIDTALFSASISENIKSEWIRAIENCCSDDQLLKIVIASQQNKESSQWLEEYIQELLHSQVPREFSHGVTLAGFSDFPSSLKCLKKLEKSLEDSWRKSLVDLSIRRHQTNLWSQHWFGEFLAIPDRLEAWRAFRLFIHIVDTRFYRWEKDLMEKSESDEIPREKTIFLQECRSRIQDVIEKREKEYSKYFMGHKIIYRQAWPWL